MNSTSIDTESVLQTIAAMCSQEASGYACSAYLHQNEPEHAISNGPMHTMLVDDDCRSKMVSWCYQVVDFCKFSRETVSVAMSYLDRFMTTSVGASGHEDGQFFQLAAMTCLYTAVKIHEPEAMDPKLVSNLSRGTYSSQQVEAMEAQLLSALQWRMHPPTALAFVRQFLELIPLHVVNESMRETAYDMAKFQTELATNVYDFITVKASTVAFGSLMNSLQSLGLDDKVLGYIGLILSHAILGVDCIDDAVLDVQTRLYPAIVSQPATFTSTEAAGIAHRHKSHGRPSFDVSPRSVSATR
jgi:hypothetical protein